MDRNLILSLMRFAGYHADSREFTRLHINSMRISKAMAIAAYRDGEDQRRNGMACTCWNCQKLDMKLMELK